jgi:outer membrane receptor protein involved in Fe transport
MRNPSKTCFRAIYLLALLAIGFFVTCPVYGQVAGATLSGTIKDPSGAVIPNAQVSIKDTATGVVRTVTADSAGLYTAPNLKPSTYEVTVSFSGFSTQVQPSITLTVGAQQVLNFSMQVGQTTETVNVTGEATAVQLSTSTLSATVQSTTVRELPLNGRDWASLATLEPGVASVRTQLALDRNGGSRGLGMQLSIGGNRPSQNSYRLDGVIINDYSNAGPGSVLGQNLGVDAIQEFSVLTSNYSAEYGFTSGGVINAVTRSGTNQIHGSAYEFLRNSALDAANFFDNSTNGVKAPFRRNQFGGSLGGPIWKDKTFIFGDYEGVRQSLSKPAIAFTPSPDARNGIMRNPDGTTTTVVVDPKIAKLLPLWPLPNAGLIGPLNNTGNYVFTSQAITPENYYTVRGDHKISDKDSLFAIYVYDHSTLTRPDTLNQILNQWASTRTAAGLEETHVFSPALVNSFRLGFNRTEGKNGLTPAALNPLATDHSLGLNPQFYAPGITVPGLTLLSGGLLGQSVQNYIGQMFELFDDSFYTRGNHSLKFGFTFIRDQNNVFAPFRSDGTSTFRSFSNFLTNQPFNVNAPLASVPITPHYDRASVFGGYLQDDWRFRPNLTFNLGLRYEMSTIPIEKYNKISNLPTIYSAPPPAGTFLPPSGFFSSNPTTKNFEPRVGFAWDPFRNGKTAVRGGIGLFDALPLPYELVIFNAQTSPYRVTCSVRNAPQGIFPSGIGALCAAPAITAQTFNYVEPNPKRNYVFQWNFNIQREIARNLTLVVAYSGSHGVHSPIKDDTVNFVLPKLTSVGYMWPNPIGSGTVLNPNVTGVQSSMWQSSSVYNGLHVKLEKRMSHGLQLQTSFTWSKTIDNASGSFAGDNFALDYTSLPWFDMKLNRGLADFNIGRNLVVNGLWEPPAPKSIKGPAGWALSGWQLGIIASVADGVPFFANFGSSGDPLGQINPTLDVPSRVAGPGCSSLVNPGNRSNYLKPQCLQLPPATPAAIAAGCDTVHSLPGTCFNLLGNLGRNTMIGPGLQNFDFSLFKNTKVSRISETFNVQFRAEFFNILNRANFSPPPLTNLQAFDATGIAVPGFGQITSTQTTSRQIQFALKFIW